MKSIESMEIAEKEKKTKSRKKIYIKRTAIVFTVLIILAGIFVVCTINDFDSADSSPINGNRGKGLISLTSQNSNSKNKKTSKTTYNQAIKDIKTAISSNNPQISNLQITLNARLFKVTFSTTSDKETAKHEAEVIIETMDQKFRETSGASNYEGSKYSTLFNKNNDKDEIGQYSVDFVIYNQENDNFPIFGTKHPCVDTISFSSKS